MEITSEICLISGAAIRKISRHPGGGVGKATSAIDQSSPNIEPSVVEVDLIRNDGKSTRILRRDLVPSHFRAALGPRLQAEGLLRREILELTSHPFPSISMILASG